MGRFDGVFNGCLTGGFDGMISGRCFYIIEQIRDDFGWILYRFACPERPDVSRNVPEPV